jgi:hypothetical protein
LLAGLEDEIGGRMGIQLQMEQMPGYLAARFTSAGEVEEVWRQYELIAEHCKRTKNTKLFIDTTGVEAKISITDRYRVGERLEIFAPHGIKIAFVSRPDQQDPKRFARQVARNRYVNIEVFTDFHAAEGWLLKWSLVR